MFYALLFSSFLHLHTPVVRPQPRQEHKAKLHHHQSLYPRQSPLYLCVQHGGGGGECVEDDGFVVYSARGEYVWRDVERLLGAATAREVTVPGALSTQTRARSTNASPSLQKKDCMTATCFLTVSYAGHLRNI